MEETEVPVGQRKPAIVPIIHVVPQHRHRKRPASYIPLPVGVPDGWDSNTFGERFKGATPVAEYALIAERFAEDEVGDMEAAVMPLDAFPAKKGGAFRDGRNRREISTVPDAPLRRTPTRRPSVDPQTTLRFFLFSSLIFLVCSLSWGIEGKFGARKAAPLLQKEAPGLKGVARPGSELELPKEPESLPAEKLQLQLPINDESLGKYENEFKHAVTNLRKAWRRAQHEVQVIFAEKYTPAGTVNDETMAPF